MLDFFFWYQAIGTPAPQPPTNQGWKIHNHLQGFKLRTSRLGVNVINVGTRMLDSLIVTLHRQIIY